MRDHFSLDLYSILISWEFIMSVCGNQSCMRVNYDFVSQNETLALSLYRLHCHTCKKIFFKWHFHSMHLKMEEKKTHTKIFCSSASPNFPLHALWQRRKCFAPNFEKKESTENPVGSWCQGGPCYLVMAE